MFAKAGAVGRQPEGFIVPGTKEESEALWKPLRGGLPADSISAALISTGFCMAGFFFTVFDTGFIANLWPACLSALLIALMSVRWWIGPAVFGAALSGVFVYQYAVKALDVFLLYWRDFFIWAFYDGEFNDIYAENGSLLLLRLAAVFFVTLAVFLLLRRLLPFPLILALSICVFAAVYIMARIDLSAAVCVCAAGIIPLVPRFYDGFVRKRSRDAKDSGENRAIMQIIAVPGAIIAVALSFFLVPQDTAAWRSRWLNDLVHDISELINGPLERNPGNESGFTLYSVGFQAEYGRLGGPVTLRGAKIFDVSGLEQPLLLRGAVMDYYDGKSWYVNGYDGDLRYKRFFWRGYRSEAFSLDKPLGGSEAKRIYQSLTKELRFDVVYSNWAFSTLFSGGRVRDAGFADRELDQDIFFNVRSELYLHYRVPLYQRINMRTRVWDVTRPDFDDAFIRLEELALKSRDTQYDNLLPRYTQIYEGLPDSVAKTAAEITQGIESPYLKAKAIQEWLSANLRYTLEPELPPEDADFVEYFLESGEGYCSYYASAMAVLARCAGLPSRYVSGFALERVHGVGQNNYRATGRTAHAWAEIYFRGIGWVEFDPLYWNAEEPLNQSAEEATPPERAPIAKPPVELEEDLPEEEPFESTLEPLEPRGVRNETLPGLGMAVFAGTAGLIVLAWRGIKLIMSSKFKYYEANRVIRRSGGLVPALGVYHADIMRLLAILGVDVRPGETLKTFPPRADMRIAIAGSSFTALSESLMRMYFSGAAPSRLELEKAWEYHNALEERVLEKLGKPAYFFRRALMPAKKSVYSK